MIVLCMRTNVSQKSLNTNRMRCEWDSDGYKHDINAREHSLSYANCVCLCVFFLLLVARSCSTFDTRCSFPFSFSARLPPLMSLTLYFQCPMLRHEHRRESICSPFWNCNSTPLLNVCLFRQIIQMNHWLWLVWNVTSFVRNASILSTVCTATDIYLCVSTYEIDTYRLLVDKFNWMHLFECFTFARCPRAQHFAKTMHTVHKTEPNKI